MDIFIQKNMLLDTIIELNEYVLSTFNSFSVNKLIETIMSLRENLNQNDDVILLNKLVDQIQYLIFENKEYIKLFYDDNNTHHIYIQEINEVISDLEDSCNKINEFISYLIGADSLSELMEEFKI